MFLLAGGTSSPRDCFRAQTIPQLFGNEDLNPDVGGVAVGVSNIVINVCLSILLRWSDDDSQTTILMLLSQVYPVMLATAISINTDNLSLFDAHFAVAVTASPASIYLAYSSVISVFGYPNKLFKVPGGHPSKMSWTKQMIRALGIALPFIWLVVNIICCFSPHAFRNSPENCQSMTIVSWAEFQAVSNFVGILDVMGRRDLWSDLKGRGGLGLLSLITMWIWAIYLVRHRYDIWDHIQARREYQRANGRHRNFLVRGFIAVFNVPLSSWFVITKSHPWTLFVIVVFLHWSWILGIAKGMVIKNYQFTYGQITSAFAIVPPILSVAKLSFFRKKALWHFLQNFLGDLVQGIRYIVTGSPNPWKPESKLISNFNLTPRHSHVEMQTLPAVSLSAVKSSDLKSNQPKGSCPRTSFHVSDRHLWIGTSFEKLRFRSMVTEVKSDYFQYAYYALWPIWQTLSGFIIMSKLEQNQILELKSMVPLVLGKRWLHKLLMVATYTCHKLLAANLWQNKLNFAEKISKINLQELGLPARLVRLLPVPKFGTVGTEAESAS